MSEVLPVGPPITIRAESLFADPDTFKFTVSRMVHPGGPFFFDNKERAAGSPLVERLFALPGVRAGKLFIAMSGGCQGCGSSEVTLRQGFEVMVRRVTPEIVDIVDTTDHAAGSKPYYQRPKTK